MTAKRLVSIDGGSLEFALEDRGWQTLGISFDKAGVSNSSGFAPSALNTVGITSHATLFRSVRIARRGLQGDLLVFTIEN